MDTKDVARAVAARVRQGLSRLDPTYFRGLRRALCRPATLFHVWETVTARRSTSSIENASKLEHLDDAGVVRCRHRAPRSIRCSRRSPPSGPVILWFGAITGSPWARRLARRRRSLAAHFRGRFTHRVADLPYVPLARWTLIGFYFFAAFAKLNRVLPPATPSDCDASTSTNSPNRCTSPPALARWPVAGCTSSRSVSRGPRCRFRSCCRCGAPDSSVSPVRLVFHGLIALDQTHLFSDFSSVLVALFIVCSSTAWHFDAIRDVVALFRGFAYRDRLRMCCAAELPG